MSSHFASLKSFSSIRFQTALYQLPYQNTRKLIKKNGGLEVAKNRQNSKPPLQILKQTKTL